MPNPLHPPPAPILRGLAAALAALLCGAAASVALEIEVAAEVMPFGRALELRAWAGFRVVGSAPERRVWFPVEAEDQVLKRFTVVTGHHPVEGRLEAIYFPAVAYVGRTCPPQQHAELVEVRPSRSGSARRDRPVADASRRGGWRGFDAEGVDRLVARYHCYPSGMEMGDDDLPPDPDQPPPEESAAPLAPGEGSGEPRG